MKPTQRKTIFSEDRKYRFTLWRKWEQEAHLITEYSVTSNLNHYAMFIGLNPSTADERKDDPTIRRCIGFAKAWGYGALCMTNLFAFRATDPFMMKIEREPVGMGNDTYILECAKNAGVIIAAWGKDGAHNDRGEWVQRMFFDCKLKLHHLGLNGDGTPKHPLYLRKDLKPIPF